MIGNAWMNVGSLAFGLAAWGLALAALLLRKGCGTAARCSAWSFAACATALCLQICYQGHLADIEDVSAFLDTAGACRLCAVVLLAVTLCLNAVAALRPHGKGEDAK